MARKRVKKSKEQIELWKQLVRGAFRAVLLGRHLSQKDAAAFRKARSDRVVFIDDAVRGEAVGTNSSDSVEAFESFELPWLPEKSVVPGLLAILGIARAISSENEIRTICSPGHLTQICIRGVSSDDDDDVVQALQTAVEQWSDEMSTENDPKEIYVKVAPNGTEGGGRANLSSLKSFRTNTAKRLRQGHAVAVVTLDLAALDRDLADICGLTLMPVPLSRDAMLELVRA